MCVTPHIISLNAAEFPETIEFIRDDKAIFTEKSLPNKWKTRKLKFRKLCQYMEMADDDLHNENLEGCRRWTTCANNELKKMGISGGFDIPESLDVVDVVKTAI